MITYKESKRRPHENGVDVNVQFLEDGKVLMNKTFNFAAKDVADDYTETISAEKDKHPEVIVHKGVITGFDDRMAKAISNIDMCIYYPTYTCKKGSRPECKACVRTDNPEQVSRGEVEELLKEKGVLSTSETWKDFKTKEISISKEVK